MVSWKASIIIDLNASIKVVWHCINSWWLRFRYVKYVAAMWRIVKPWEFIFSTLIALTCLLVFLSDHSHLFIVLLALIGSGPPRVYRNTLRSVFYFCSFNIFLWGGVGLGNEGLSMKRCLYIYTLLQNYRTFFFFFFSKITSCQFFCCVFYVLLIR